MSTKIQWTEETWNPLLGCSKISPGCKNCYAIQTAWIRAHNPKMAERYAGVVEKTPGGALNWTGKVNVAKEAMEKPLRQKKPTMYFVNSMSDLFHESVPFSVIHEILNITAACSQHTFQILTKRPARMLEYVKWFQRGGRYNLDLGPNVWIGVSVENQQTANERIPLLLQVPAAVRFLSCEPLIGPVDLENLSWYDTSYYQVLKPITGCGDSNRPAIDWVIVGGESGANARPMHPDWVRKLRDQCQAYGKAFFFKQWGTYYTKSILLGSGNPVFRMFESMQHWINKATTWVCGGRCISIDGRECHIGKDFQECAYPVAIMDKVGKNKSGRELDGREWNEFPNVGKQTVASDDPDLHTGGFDL